MKKSLFLLALVAVLTACSESYSIHGTSSVSRLDGSKLYLKVFKNKELVSLDSCEVVHGKFCFSGALDTTQLASLYMDDQSLMPLVIEKGDIKITIDNAQQKVSGTALNELLYEFLDKHTRLQNDMQELDHRFSQMVLEGVDESEIERVLSSKAAAITAQEDSLVTAFVEANFDNVLAPFVFVQMASSLPQVEHIMTKAPDAFKQNPMVSEFYQMVTENVGGGKPVRDEVTSPADIDDATIQDILNGNEDTH